MAKKTTPIITHAEILVRAIRSFQDEIEELQKKPSYLGPGADEEFKAMTMDMVKSLAAPLLQKLEALKELYRIETGTEYV